MDKTEMTPEQKAARAREIAKAMVTLECKENHKANAKAKRRAANKVASAARKKNRR